LLLTNKKAMSMKIRSLIFVISWLFAFNAFSQCPFTPTFTYNYTFQQCSEIVFTDSSVPSAGYVILQMTEALPLVQAVQPHKQ